MCIRDSNRPLLPRLPRLQTRPTRSKPNSETDLIIKVKLPMKTVQQLRRIMYDTDKKGMNIWVQLI